MKNLTFCTCLVLLLFFLFSCKDDSVDIVPKDEETEAIALVKISGFDQNNTFIDANGKTFFPWGYNYTNVDKIGLIEDNWDSEDTWKIIADDFEEMKLYTANIVRVHLQYHKFMLDKNTPDPKAIANLQRLVQIAERTGLYLDITGLAAYRKDDSPEWYDALDDTERWATQAIFWKSIAAAVGKSKSVFAFNLMNEPVVSVGCAVSEECEWLPGESFGGFHFIQNITKTPNLNFKDVMTDWIQTLTTAIREEDQTTMITVGFLSLGPLERFESDLDYLSVHIYPKSGELQESIDYIKGNTSNKPLVIEETSNLRCSPEELKTFLLEIDGSYNGLMGHYFGKTLEEMEASGSIVDALHKKAVEFVIDNNPN